MPETRAPRRLGDDARRHLHLVMADARDAADLASAHASVGDVPGLLHELRRGLAFHISAIKTLEEITDTEPQARRAA